MAKWHDKVRAMASYTDYTDDEVEFMKAMDRFKRENNRPFPTWGEVLSVLISLGYRKVTSADEGESRQQGTGPQPKKDS